MTGFGGVVVPGGIVGGASYFVRDEVEGEGFLFIVEPGNGQAVDCTVFQLEVSYSVERNRVTLRINSW